MVAEHFVFVQTRCGTALLFKTILDDQSMRSMVAAIKSGMDLVDDIVGPDDNWTVRCEKQLPEGGMRHGPK